MIRHDTAPTAISAREGISARLASLVGCAPGQVAFVGRDGRATTSTSWDALLRRGVRLSAGLEWAGCPPGAPVAIQGATSPGVVAAILGMLVAGRPFVVLPPLGSRGRSEDADLLGGRDELVADRVVDSLGLVEVLNAIEDRFGIPLDGFLDGEERVTLRDIAAHIVHAAAVAGVGRTTGPGVPDHGRG